MDYQEAGQTLYEDLRMRTMPIGVKFLKSDEEPPEKTRWPSEAMGKRITICQGVTLARLYRWTVGLRKQDLICVPAMITFGFTNASDPMGTLAKLFCQVSFAESAETAAKETASMDHFDKGQYQAILMAPLQKGMFEPDVIALYCNPAQIMRLAQAWAFKTGERIGGQLGGKVECSEYLIAPFKAEKPSITIPGNGDRIFSMTQDDEMVFSLPAAALPAIMDGLKEAGKKLGARYPVTFYQNFQPDFPKVYKQTGEEVEAF